MSSRGCTPSSSCYPGVHAEPPRGDRPGADIALPLRLRGDGGDLTFLSAQITFGTAVDITLAELLLEAFYPADELTAAACRAR